jgi:hypothetical protein
MSITPLSSGNFVRSNLDRNLHALAICYGILGGFVGLVVSVFAIIWFGSAVVGSGSISLVGTAFLLVLLLVAATIAMAVFEVASSLRNHERRTFCLVVAWLVCAFFPLGTVLGVLTILQLIQPEAERTFSEAERPYVKMEDFRNQAGSPAPE